MERKIFLIWSNEPNHSSVFSSFESLLIQREWDVIDLLDLESLEKFTLRNNDLVCCLGIFRSIDNDFTLEETRQIDKFCQQSGNCLVVALSGKISQQDYASQLYNINLILQKFFGIKFNRDQVIRPNPYENYHPKEALLQDFIVNRGLHDTLAKYYIKQPEIFTVVDNINSSQLPSSTSSSSSSEEGKSLLNTNDGPKFLYAHGCTINVIDSKSSTIMMTSSKWALPSDQAICTFHKNDQLDSRMIAIGSAKIFEDKYINKEDNKAILESLIEFIQDREFQINISDAKTIELPEYNLTPDVNQIIDKPIGCLQQSEPLPEDRTTLINRKLFSLDCSMLPKISRAYRDLDLSYEPLTLIKPELDCCHLKFEPATHGFLLRRRDNNNNNKGGHSKSMKQ